MPVPVPINERIDLSLVRNEGFEYKWENIQNDDLSLVDLTPLSVSLSLYDRSSPPVLKFSLTPPLSSGLGFGSFGFTALQTDISGPYDYVIQDITNIATPINLVHGVFTFVDTNLVIPWSDIVANEIPLPMVIPQSYIDIDSTKWRSILLSKPGNTDLVNATQNDPSTWPMIYNFLIAKLVVYDYIERNLKAMVGSDLVKKITTGPSDVEFVDPEKLLKAYGGVDAVNGLKSDICEIASTLTIYLGICGKRRIPFVPQRQGLPNIHRRFILPVLSKYYF